MTAPSDAQKIAALSAFVIHRLAALDVAVAHVPNVVPADYRAMVSNSASAAAAAAVGAGLDAPSAAQLGESIESDVVAARQTITPASIRGLLDRLTEPSAPRGSQGKPNG